MNAIRQIVKPVNGKLMIEVPKGMDNESFEVIVMPLNNTDDTLLNILKISNNHSLKKELEDCMNDLQNEAKKNGLTQEVLADILADGE
jgi:hypothetical protein